MLECASRDFGIDMDTPWADLPEEHKDIILNGSGERKFHFTMSVILEMCLIKIWFSLDNQ